MYRVHLAAFPQVSGSKSQRRLANLSNRNRRDKCRTDGQVSPLQDHWLRKLHPLTAKVCAELLTEHGREHRSLPTVLDDLVKRDPATARVLIVDGAS
jgi:hypothetical protein